MRGRGRSACGSWRVKRALSYILAALLAGYVGFRLAPRSDSSVAQLQTCESSLEIERMASANLAKQANDADRKCDERVDKMLMERKP